MSGPTHPEERAGGASGCLSGGSSALAERIRRCCGDPELLRTLSARIQLPRTIRELAGDLFKLYRESAGLAAV